MRETESKVEISQRTPSPSIQTNALARLLANSSVLVFGLASAAITARRLGPAGKGTLSTLLFISILLTFVCSLGLGDATVILRGRGKTTLQAALASAVPLVVITSLGGIGALWAIGWIAGWANISAALVVASVFLPIRTVVYVLTALENGLERLVWTSVVRIVQLTADVLALVVFVLLLDMGIFGGVLAGAVGTAISLLLLVVSLRKRGYSFRPRFDRGFLRAAVRLGVVLESAYLLNNLTQRFDLILVYALSGEAAAGIYSIALTVGQIVSYPASAIVGAAFPRLANVSEAEALRLTPVIGRLGLATALVAALVLLPISLLIPVLFGPGFAGAVAPAAMLVVATLVWSEQWILTRPAAACGNERMYLACFGTNLVVLISLDLLLIPSFGTMGAAVASLIAPIAGLGVYLNWYLRQPIHRPLGEFIPARDDFAALKDYAVSLFRGTASNPL